MSGMLVPPCRSSVESISGLVEHVTFFNEETGFAVLRVKVKGRRDLVTVVGSLASANAGEWLVAEGAWIRDRQHGLQFKAERIQASPPDSKEGIEKYLGSGLIKGIGPVNAKRMVKKFGARVFDIIENYSARLEEIGGIGPERRRRIKDAWNEQKAVREIMVFLHSHGVSTSRAVRIFKMYGSEAIDKVREDPYRLARDIHGIGFQSADQIARQIGIAEDSVLRARAGLDHVLLEATHQGHCALPRAELITRTAELLSTDEEPINAALSKSISDEVLFPEQIGSDTLIFLQALRAAEISIARVADRLLTVQPAYPEIDIERAIEWFEGNSEVRLAAGQKDALRSAVSNRLLVITGGPGVGKTTLINAMISILDRKDVRILLCAPTGRAAKRMSEATGREAQTIHRLLDVKQGAGFARNERSPLVCDLLIVDECSMIDVSLAAALMKALPANAALVLVGDIDQLPSVGPGSFLRDLIGCGRVPVASLTEIFRQAETSRIVSAAHAVNHGRLPPLEPSGDSDFLFLDRDDPDKAVATLINLVTNRIPKRFGVDPVRDIQILSPMNRGSLGVRELNVALQSALNPPVEHGANEVERFGWKFRVGDKVIQTVNNYDKSVFNGDIGLIARVDGGEQEIVVDYDGNRVSYEFGELDELSPAYAITIHKSQGSEFPVVIVPVSTQHYMLLQRNLLYTAITRGRRLVVLIGQEKAAAMAARNNETRRRFGGLGHRLEKRADG